MTNDFHSTLTELATLEKQINTEFEMQTNVNKMLKATGTEPVSLKSDKGDKKNVQFSSDTKKGGGKQGGGKPPKCDNCGKNHHGECRKPKKNAKQGGGAKYKGFDASKKTYESIRTAVLAEERKRKADDDNGGDERWMKGTTKAQQAYMIREIGADEDDTVDMNSFSAKRLRSLKKEAKEWCDNNGL